MQVHVPQPICLSEIPELDNNLNDLTPFLILLFYGAF
jgi:hypothetical protein